jgi:hypothetical protein
MSARIGSKVTRTFSPRSVSDRGLKVRVTLAVLFILALLPAASAGDTLWSAVVLATNADKPKDPPAELREFAPRLKRVFDRNQFEIVGTASKPIEDRKEVWLVPTPNFWFGVRPRRATSIEARGGYLLSLQLFQDKRQIVDSEARLAPGSPLFIRGPECANGGQFVFVLQVQK